MARKVFFSFHFDGDCWRTSQVREIGTIEKNKPISDNAWEAVKAGGDPAIKKWIADQIKGTSCAVVLIGAETANRRWVPYELSEAWNSGKGVVGVRIHNLKDQNGKQSVKGGNPLTKVTFKDSDKTLASIAETYDPPYADSKDAYKCIADNLASWVEKAISIRAAN